MSKKTGRPRIFDSQSEPMDKYSITIPARHWRIARGFTPEKTLSAGVRYAIERCSRELIADEKLRRSFCPD